MPVALHQPPEMPVLPFVVEYGDSRLAHGREGQAIDKLTIDIGNYWKTRSTNFLDHDPRHESQASTARADSVDDDFPTIPFEIVSRFTVVFTRIEDMKYLPIEDESDSAGDRQ